MPDDFDMLHKLQEIRQAIYRMQEAIHNQTAMDQFNALSKVVELCDEAIDAEIHRPIKNS
ncbi:MAG TPA: hypothetical protein VMQ17_08930 [Candidatus Sulfotelmatobacter sp.]|nr:hypothetical protein [Candidatus Sulfotelmatobacter sp.]